MRIEGYSTWSVCLCVDACSGTTGYEAAYEQYQRVQNYTSLKNIQAIFLKWLHSTYMPWKQAKKPIIMHNRAGLPPPDPLTLSTLGTRSLNEVHVSTTACYVSTSS